MTEIVVARLVPPPVSKNDLSVSVIIPCKDEKGNVEDAVRRIPQLGGRDRNYFLRRSIERWDRRRNRASAVRSTRTRTFAWRKGQVFASRRNVWTGFDAATCDILMILDADLTTMPEELPYFLEVIASGQAEFVNGSRLVYPVPKGRNENSEHAGQQIFQRRFHLSPRSKG